MYCEYYPTVFDINYSKYRKLKVILFDIDNTISPFGKCKINDKLVEYMRMLKNEKGYRIILFSNTATKRIIKFAKLLDVEYFTKAYKPFSRKIRKLLVQEHYLPEEILFVGDQIFTDVVCANRYKIYSVIVEPLSHLEDPMCMIRRIVEYPIRKCLRKKFFEDKYRRLHRQKTISR